jgi:hypothetical protein
VLSARTVLTDLARYLLASAWRMYALNTSLDKYLCSGLVQSVQVWRIALNGQTQSLYDRVARRKARASQARQQEPFRSCVESALCYAVKYAKRCALLTSTAHDMRGRKEQSH